MSTATAAPPGAKKRDYWWTVFATDPLAVPLVRLLAAKRWLSPDQVSWISFLLGASVGAFFASGSRAGLIVGGIVFYLAFLFDCIDGKLARATGVTSRRGQALDHLSDATRRAGGSAGLALYVWRTEADASVLFVVAYVVLAYYFLEVSGAERGETGGGLAGRWSQALARRRLLPTPGMPDVQAVVFILGPLTGFVFVALAIAMLMLAFGIAINVRRRFRHGAPP